MHILRYSKDSWNIIKDRLDIYIQLTWGGRVELLCLGVSTKRIDWWEDDQTEGEQENLKVQWKSEKNSRAWQRPSHWEKKKSQFTITQVLVVLAFMVDIFTIAWSFLSCSINDLFIYKNQTKTRGRVQCNWFRSLTRLCKNPEAKKWLLTCSVSEAFGLSSVVPGCVQCRWPPCDRNQFII